MKTAQQFYEMHHPIDLGICTKEECIKMMNGYSNYLIAIKLLNGTESELLVCESYYANNLSMQKECLNCGKLSTEH
jgi:hypothetical protein